MARFKKTVGFLIILMALLIVIWSIYSQKSYSFNEVRINAAVLTDGSMQINEQRTADFKGSYSRMFVDIPIIGFKELSDIQVSEGSKQYLSTKITADRPDGQYSVTKQNNSYHIEWYFKTDGGRRIFNLSYKVVDCVKVYPDVAELNWKFIGERSEVGIKNVTVVLNIPVGAKLAEVRAWGHGPLNGQVKINSPQEVVWQVQDLPAMRFLEGRVVFPVQLVPQAKPVSGSPGLPSILAQEQQWQTQADNERARARLEIAGGLLLAIIGSLLALVIYRRWGRRFKPDLQVDYYRELPGQYSPADTAVLYYFKEMKAAAVVATLMDLARRGYLRLQEVDKERPRLGGLLGSSHQKDVLIQRVKPADSELLPHESLLLEFFFAKLGGGEDKVSFGRLKDYSRQNSQEFKTFWDTWKSILLLRSEELGFFDTNSSRGKWLNRALALLAVIGGIIALNNNYYYPAGGLFIWTVVAFLFSLRGERRSRYGESQFALWEAFRRFLKDFSNLDQATLPQLVLWEHYLVYAVALGVAKEVLQQLPIVYPEVNDPATGFGSYWYPYAVTNDSMQIGGGVGGPAFSSLATLTTMVSSLESTWEAAFGSTGGSSSSSDGGGGGFSSGGGGGGGGGSWGAD